MPEVPGDTAGYEERKARTLVEKKTAINLIEAFAVAVKHYLRGEDGIFYEDLYHLVKFLPPYALPAGLPSVVDLSEMPTGRSSDGTRHSASRSEPRKTAEDQLPLPVTSEPRSPTSKTSKVRPGDENFLLPARIPPQFAIFDVFPFSLLVRQLTKRGKDIKGKKAARLRAREHVISHNIPLEISLYLVRFELCCPAVADSSHLQSSYVSALQNRKAIDAGTTSEHPQERPTIPTLIVHRSRLVELSARPHRLADRPRAHPDHAHSVLIFHPSMGRYRDLLYGSPFPNPDQHELDYDSWYDHSGMCFV